MYPSETENAPSDPEMGLLWVLGHYLNKYRKGPIAGATYQILRLKISWFRRFIYTFYIQYKLENSKLELLKCSHKF